MPQHDPALLRLQNISSSELISAIKVKQFAVSGPFNGALPLWLDNDKWIIKDGWFSNPGPMTMRLDKDTAGRPLTGCAIWKWPPRGRGSTSITSAC